MSTNSEPVPGAASVTPEVRSSGPQGPSPDAGLDPSNAEAGNALAAKVQTVLGGPVEDASPKEVDSGLAAAAGLPSEAATSVQDPTAGLEVLAGEKAPAEDIGLSSDEIKNLSNNAYEYLRAEGDYHQYDLMFGRRDALSPEIGQRFDAHGIAKGSIKEQLEALNYLLTKGIDPSRPFHSTALRMPDADEIAIAPAMGAAGPYDTGSFIVIGKPDQSIRDGIGAVLVNEGYYQAIPTLQEKFPNVKFIKASEMTEGLSSMIEESSPDSAAKPETGAGTAGVPEPGTAQDAGRPNVTEAGADAGAATTAEAGGARPEAAEPAKTSAEAAPADSTSTGPKAETSSGPAAGPTAEIPTVTGAGPAESAATIVASAGPKSEAPAETQTQPPTEVDNGQEQNAITETPGYYEAKEVRELARAISSGATKRELAMHEERIRVAILKDTLIRTGANKRTFDESEGSAPTGRVSRLLHRLSGGGKRSESANQADQDYAEAVRNDGRSVEARFAEAKKVHGEAKNELEQAKKTGDQNKIKAAEERYNMVNEYYLLVKGENRRNLRKELLKLLAALGFTATMEVSTQVREGGQQQKGHA